MVCRNAARHATGARQPARALREGGAAGMSLRVRFLLPCAALMAAAIASAAPRTYTESDFARVEKIDAHVHLGGEMPVFMAQAAADNVRVLTINVNCVEFGPIDVQLHDAVEL